MKWPKLIVPTSGLVSICLLAGCSDSIHSPLVGTWQIATAEFVSQDVAADDTSESNMTVEFLATGKLITKTQMGKIDSLKEGTWKVRRADDSEIELQCTLQMQTTQHVVRWVDKDTIRWVPPNMAGTTSKLTFQRKK